MNAKGSLGGRSEQLSFLDFEMLALRTTPHNCIYRGHMRKRGKVLRSPHAGPGLLMVEGRQYPFSLESLWKSQGSPQPGLDKTKWSFSKKLAAKFGRSK